MIRTREKGVALKRISFSSIFAVFMVFLFSFLFSKTPRASLFAFFVSPFSNISSFLSMLENAAPLCICALGVIVSFRAGLYSLGGEGQIYSGVFVSCLVSLWLAKNPLFFQNPFLCKLISMTMASFAGGFVALFPALGYRFKKSDVLLISILISQAVVLVIDWAISDPFHSTNGNLVAMERISPLLLLKRLAPPSIITFSPIFAIILCLLTSFYFNKTKIGLKHDLFGLNSSFAFYRGLNTNLYSVLPIIVCGMLHGLGGSLITLGIKGTAIRGMSAGLGWTAIGAALIAGSRPGLLPIAVFILTWLDAGARQASILSDLPSDAGNVIKAFVIIAVSAKPVLKLFSKKTKTKQSILN